MQNKLELRKDLERVGNECSSIMEAMEDPKATPGQIAQMEDSLHRCYLNIDCIEGLLQEEED